VGPAVKLAKIQNKCLQVIAGAYKATPTSVLETETSIPPLDLYLNDRLANFRFRHKEMLVTEAYTQIRGKLAQRQRQERGRNLNRNTHTEGEKRTQWAEEWKQQKQRTEMPLLASWKRRWEANRPKWGLIGVGPPSEEPPKIYKELKKAESSILTQIQTGRIGLAAFLNKAKVPSFPSPKC